MRLIGIKGRYHSGKDTAVAHIRAAAGPGKCVQRIGYADRMKLSGVRALGYEPQSTEEAIAIADAIKERCRIQVCDDFGVIKQISGRKFWQRYGTEAHREIFGFDFWLDVLLPLPPKGSNVERQFKILFPGIDVLCITDCRLENEARRVLDMGGEVWVIDADERLGPLPEDAHITEQPISPEFVTLTVMNNKGLEEFEQAVKEAYTLSTTDKGMWS